MDKEKVVALRRHELLLLNMVGRRAILSGQRHKLSSQELQLAEIMLTRTKNNCYIPFIVRREDNYSGQQVPCGFVHPELVAGRRWRLACFTEPKYIQGVLSPYDVFGMSVGVRNKPLETLVEVKKIAANRQLNVGLLGSLALELYTGLNYSNEHSDIDLLLKGAGLGEIKVFYEQANEVAIRQQIRIDLEIELTNGYGVKAPELFMDTKTILAKSKQDVVLLNRADVLACLK